MSPRPPVYEIVLKQATVFAILARHLGIDPALIANYRIDEEIRARPLWIRFTRPVRMDPER